MQIQTFTYTKANKSVSKRVVVVIAPARANMMGIDVSELNDSDQVTAAIEIGDAYEDYLLKVKQIQANYDIVHNLRQFKPENMADVETEVV
jgi:GTP-sensing pleiotropic transcriptional regulator CodY